LQHAGREQLQILKGILPSIYISFKLILYQFILVLKYYVWLDIRNQLKVEYIILSAIFTLQ